jgi:glycosyltransferase involved in cell wall biosynthesis
VNASKRVVHVTSLAITVRRFLDAQLCALCDDGWRVTVVTSFGAGPNRPIVDRSYEHVCVNLPRGLAPVADVIALARLRGLFERLEPEVVHTHSPKAALLALAAARSAGVPRRYHTVHSFHHLRARGRIERKLAEWWEMQSVRSADLTLFVSEVDRAYATRARSVHGPFVWLGNGVDAERFRPAATEAARDALREALGLPNEAFVVCSTSRFSREKGLGNLFDAFARFARTRPDAFLVVCGTALPGDRAPFKPADARAAGCPEPRTRFLGWVDDPAPILQAADVLVLLSDGEGRSTSMMEACAVGLPLVASSIPAMKEIVREGENGFLVPQRDVRRAAGALHALAADVAMRRRMGSRSREIALQRFGQEEVIERLRAIYASAVEVRR